MPRNNVTSSFINNHFCDQNYRSCFTRDGYKSLRTYLGNVSKGNPKIYTAPFAKGRDIQKVLDEWINGSLVSIRDQWPSLWEFEIDLASKVGPLSIQKPLRERMDDIRHYYEDILLPSKEIHPMAMTQSVADYVSACGLRLRSQKLTVNKMKKSTNSGSPYFTKRRNVVDSTVPCEGWLYDWRHGPDVHIKLPEFDGDCAAVIGWRGQEGGPSEEDVKQRVVWMFPFSVNVQELQVYQPLIESFQKLNLVPAWVSMDAVDREITKLFDTKSSEDLVVCTDFSRFDQHFNPHMQECAKAIIGNLLTKDSQSEMWLKEVFPIKYGIPLAWETTNEEDVTYFNGWHGMASGSGGTNVDETLVHHTLQNEAAMLADQPLNPHSMCLGDDGILTYPGITVDEVVKAYESHGQECNKSKQYAATQDCVYLRRWHHADYRPNGECAGVYSTCRAIGRLRYLERFMDPEYWSPEMVALRQLSIIENCNHHPLFEQFVQFCMKRDKYRLGIDIPGFLDNITQLSKEAIDHMPDFLGYTKTLQGEGPSSIADWRVVKYLKSVR